MSSITHSSNLQYPLRIRRAVTALATLVLLVSAAEYVLAWLRAFYGLFAAPLQLPPMVFLATTGDILPMLLTAHIGFAFALFTIGGIAFLCPQIIVRTDGLVMRTTFGTRVVPFAQLRRIR